MTTNRIKAVSAHLCAATIGLALFVVESEAATLSKFTGGDTGEGLDFKNDAGGFVYGLNFRATSGANVGVGDVTFLSTTASSPPAGVTVVSYPSPFDNLTSLGFPGPFEFGPTANDNNLEVVMNSGVTVNASSFQLRLAVTPGRLYKLQLLMLSNAGAHRPANYTIDGAGTTLIDIPSDPASYPSASYVVTELFTATNATETITITYANVSPPNNFSFIHGLTLEYIPEPTTVALLALGGMLLWRKR